MSRHPCTTIVSSRKNTKHDSNAYPNVARQGRRCTEVGLASLPHDWTFSPARYTHDRPMLPRKRSRNNAALVMSEELQTDPANVDCGTRWVYGQRHQVAVMVVIPDSIEERVARGWHELGEDNGIPANKRWTVRGSWRCASRKGFA